MPWRCKSVTDIQKIIGYLSKKLDYVHHIYASLEDNLSKDIDSLANSGLSEQDVGRYYHRLEYIIGNLFRQAMLIMVCSYLEEAMNLVGEVAISDYSMRINKKKKGNWFNKRKSLFEMTGVSFKGTEKECDDINDLIEVRNCIVHAGGSIEKYKYPKRVEEAVARLKERYKDGNFNLVEISGDKFLYLGDNVIATAIIASEKIIKHCSKITSGKA